MKQKRKYLLLIAGIVVAVGLMVAIATLVLDRSKRAEGIDENEQLAEIDTGAETRADEPAEPFEPYGSIVDPGVLEWESAARDLTLQGSYRNGGIVSWEYGEGRSIYAGIEADELTDALYLGLNCSESADGNEIGYYITASTGSLQYSRGFVGEYDAAENAAFTDFVVADRLYTRVRAIQFNDVRDYGIRWTDEYSVAETGEGARLLVRAVNLANGALVCICDIEIGYDTEEGMFYIDTIHPVDVKQSGELSETLRTELIERALGFTEETLEIGLGDVDWSDVGIEGGNYDWQDAAQEGAVVDKVQRPYFNKLLDKTGRTVTFLNDFPDCSDTFAVTLPLPLYGYVTVYFAPWNEIHQIPAEYNGESELQRLELHGYDPLLPRSEKTILVPHDGAWDKYIPSY